MIGMSTESRKKNYQMSESRTARQELNIRNIKEVLSTLNPFKIQEEHDGTEYRLYNLITKSVLSHDLQKTILETENKGHTALTNFVEEQIRSSKSLWGKITMMKLPGWTSESKKFTVKSRNETLKATNSLFARLLVTARSTCEDIDLKNAIRNYEFSAINYILRISDGKLHPSSDKSKLTHALERLGDS